MKKEALIALSVLALGAAPAFAAEPVDAAKKAVEPAAEVVKEAAAEKADAAKEAVKDATAPAVEKADAAEKAVDEASKAADAPKK